MNIQTREEFDQFLIDLQEQEIKVFDVETNGLEPYNGNKIISLSVYFPAIDRSYNVPFRYGHGKINVRYNDTHPEGMPFEQMSWQGNAKKDLYLQYWFNRYRETMGTDSFGNLPIFWLDEIKAVWGKGIYMGHNTRFDAHFLNAEGFPDMETFYDTMIALHIVNEDWGNVELDAPYTYTNKDKTNGLCSEAEVGSWAREADGTLKTRKQYGRRGLKWQAARIGLPGATEGETGLRDARIKFEDKLTWFIVDDWQNSMNAGIFTKKIMNGLSSGDVDAYEEARQLAFDKVRSKIEINDKANMWMLPSWSVSHYAELDVILTWGLYQWCLPIIQEWDNEELFEQVSHIHQHVAWEMERNGFKIDRKTAYEEIAKLEPRIKEIEGVINQLALRYMNQENKRYLAGELPNYDHLKNFITLVESGGFNINSNDQLLVLLNSGILGTDFPTEYWPEWFDEKKRLETKVYPNVRLVVDELDEQFDPLEGTNKQEFDRVTDHGIIRLLREYRMMKKSIDTYLKKWLKAADTNDVVRFNMNTDGTVAGRMSSSGAAGNGQNIPDRNGYTIKRAIVPYSDEWVLVAFDYGQLELRLACWIAEVQLNLDPAHTMTNLFLSGADMHSYTRDSINVRKILYGDMTNEEILIKLGYNLNSDKLQTDEQRQHAVDYDRCRYVAKTMNFGLLYSGGAPMLMKLLKLDDVKVAKALVNNWRGLYPAFPRANQYFTDLASTYRSNPAGKRRLFVRQPISGRYRKFDMYPKWKNFFKDGKWQGFNPQEAAQRKVWNNTVQGLGGFLCTKSADNIYEAFGTENIKMFANIHDALEMFVHRDYLVNVPTFAEIMKDWPITPALTVDIQGSKDGTWQGMTKIEDMQLWIDSKGKEGYPKPKEKKS